MVFDDGLSCDKCNKHIDFCFDCYSDASGPICTDCETNYWLQDNKCQTCGQLITDCDTCAKQDG